MAVFPINSISFSRRAQGVTLALWTILALFALGGNLYVVQSAVEKMAHDQAAALYGKDLLYRRWNAQHGGVYAAVDANTPVNPYLEKMGIDDLQVTTPSGHLLTLINPAYMTRQVLELQEREWQVKGHLASLQPVNPQNAPDPWERSALLYFEQGGKELHAAEEIDGRPYMRVMYPFVTEESCLRCHAAQGYRVGNVRGGISISVPLAPFYDIRDRYYASFALSYLLIWLLGAIGIVVNFSRNRRSEEQRLKAEADLQQEHLKLQSAYDDLQESLEQVKQLEGILPICMYCKKIRDDQQLWDGVESYIQKHSSAEFSHGICPDCFEKHFGDEALQKKRRKDD